MRDSIPSLRTGEGSFCPSCQCGEELTPRPLPAGGRASSRGPHPDALALRAGCPASALPDTEMGVLPLPPARLCVRSVLGFGPWPLSELKGTTSCLMPANRSIFTVTPGINTPPPDASQAPLGAPGVTFYPSRTFPKRESCPTADAMLRDAARKYSSFSSNPMNRRPLRTET